MSRLVYAIYDNTRLSSAKDCLRRYYFRHHRHWTGEGATPPLAFGSAWHSAMEAVWPLMCLPIERMPGLDTIVHEGHRAFLEKWEEQGMNPRLSYEEEAELAPRTPARAFEMLVEYVSKRLEHMDDMELIKVEKPFIVPLDDNTYYVGKIDKVVRRRGKVVGIEHKTTTAYARNGGFRGSFLDSFSPNSQVDGYLYVLHLTYPGEVGGVWVDAALVHKQETAFVYIPIEKQYEHLDAWIWEARYWVRVIEEELEKLTLVEPEANFMAAFPKNTNSCFNFSVSCPYLDCCKAWPNPVGKTIPPGMVEEKWDPLQEIEGVADLLKQHRKPIRGNSL